jgi:hypothetical protein
MRTDRAVWTLLVSLALATLSCGPPLSADARSWWSHVQFLADDRLEGRNTGSAGHLRAAEYVANEFRHYGAAPGGEAVLPGADRLPIRDPKLERYLQPVHFISRQVREPECQVYLEHAGKLDTLVLGTDANLGMGIESAPEIDAPAVFVGYGLSVPEVGYDDLKGLDLRGKIAVSLQGGPASMPGPLKSHAQSSEQRWKSLKAAGAIGYATIPNPKFMDIPWERGTLARLHPSMSLADSALDDSRGAQFSLRINPARADRWFAGSGHALHDLMDLANREQPLPRFPLPCAIHARIRYDRAPIESPNVVAFIPGSDEHLGNEYIVLSAHLDHLGIGGAIKGDSVYNGAMDNASGVASLIEIARMIHASGTKLRRSLVLLAVTGEEKGLLGSRYFAAHPTIPIHHIVADVNLDMFLPIIPFKILTVYGLDESDLGDIAKEVADRYDIRVQRDPQPQRNSFIRSDQYSFIRRGVPALSFKIGAEPGSPEDKVMKLWTKERYHAPSDDLKQPVNREAAAEFTRLLMNYAITVANRKDRPLWKPSSFFKRYAVEGHPVSLAR